VERVTGIEPALSAWEADVLPLNYTRGPLRLEPLRAEPRLPYAEPGQPRRALTGGQADGRLTRAHFAGDNRPPREATSVRSTRVSSEDWVRREALTEYLRGALWALPSLAVVIALAAGSVLSQIHVPNDSWASRFLFQGTADDARNLLIAISSTMVTVIALVLGLTLVALQLASTQFSPRLLRNFLRDRTNQVVLSAFVATFTYSSAGLYTVGVAGGQRTDSYPQLAVTGALGLLFLSLVLLVYFVHHLSHSIQIDQIMARVERSTLAVIDHDLPTVGVTRDELPEHPAWALPLPAYRSGYVQTLHPENLVDLAAASDVTVSVTPMVGEHIVSGTPLGWVWTATPDDPAPAVDSWEQPMHDAVRLGFERTAEQDIAFGVRQLTDIAVKALSPAVNDPYTGIQSLEHISTVLSALATRKLGGQLLTDESGHVRVVVHGRDLSYYLDFACGQIRRYGASEPRVMLAILRTLRTTGSFCVDPRDRRAVIAQVRLVLADGEREIAQPADLVPVRTLAESVLTELGA
jgi:uncharacterized membrane protein